MAIIDSLRASFANIIVGAGRINPSDNAGPRAGEGDLSSGFDAGIARSIVQSMDAGDLYATQPHLRTVVSFIARNTAQLGRHVYAKTEEGRERINNGPAPQLLASPNEYMTGYDLFNMLFSELALYDMAVWVPSLRGGKWVIDPIPGAWITGIKKATAFQMAGYRVKDPTKSDEVFLPAADVVVFRGYSPEGFQRGSSAVRSLQGTLAEQVASLDFRQQMWNRGGRVGMFMTRPATAPEWSKEAKTKFIQSWRANWSGNGASAGSTPLLEDGMELKRLGFTAKEEQWLEAATLSLSTVAGAYHVPPAMVGVSGYNSFASVKEFRKMLYTETMGPSIAQVEDTINTFLFPFVGVPSDQYFELNIGEKLQGDFEEQGNVLFQAVGGPYMTPDEARSKVNMPKIDGGDVLLAPLNMGAAGNNGPLADEPIGTDLEPATNTPATTDKPEATTVVGNLTVDDIVKLIGAASALIRSGFDPEASLIAVGLDPVKHLGLLPVTVQKPLTPEGDVDDALVEDVATAGKAGSDQETKARRAISDSDLVTLKNALDAFFSRQRRATVAALGSKDASWWNQKKWNQELSGVLLPHMTSLSAGAARAAAGAKGLNADDYSVGRTTAFLTAVADSRADLINSTTRDRLETAVSDDEDDDPAAAINHVYDETYGSRAQDTAKTLGTFIGAWATTEMARQLVPDKAPTKTWRSSGAATSRHNDMDGETVGLDDTFSNGANWPGDPVLGAEGVANCECGVDINYAD